MTHRERVQGAKEKVLEAAKRWRRALVIGISANIYDAELRLVAEIDEWQRLESETCGECGGGGTVPSQSTGGPPLTTEIPCPAGCVEGKKA